MIDKRLRAIADLIRSGVKVCDVGTDHGYLPCYLVSQGKSTHVIAADINEKPLNCARIHIEKTGLNDKVKIVLSDGLKEISSLDADDIVIAGMGGELIFKIMTDVTWTKDKTKRFILQPMTQVGFLRESLLADGFDIVSEVPVIDRRHCYTVMLAEYSGVKKEISPKQFFFGDMCEKKDELSKQYVRFQITKMRKALYGMRKSRSHYTEAAQIEQAIACAEEQKDG